MNNTLLHMCCAPCSITCIDTLRADGLTPTGFWLNPNIHPFTEYRARKQALDLYCDMMELPLVTEGDYGLRPFLQALGGESENRCGYCYRIRLEGAARHAAAQGFESFTTTLLVSPYQNRELLVATGEELGRQYGVSFLPYDFRPRFREGQQRARELALYMQKYCGCIFSEEERYAKARK